MCDKCLKLVIGKEIMDLESKVERLFKKMEANPTLLKHDADFVRFADTMGTLLKRYESLK